MNAARIRKPESINIVAGPAGPGPVAASKVPGPPLPSGASHPFMAAQYPSADAVARAPPVVDWRPFSFGSSRGGLKNKEREDSGWRVTFLESKKGVLLSEPARASRPNPRKAARKRETKAPGGTRSCGGYTRREEEGKGGKTGSPKMAVNLQPQNRFIFSKFCKSSCTLGTTFSVPHHPSREVTYFSPIKTHGSPPLYPLSRSHLHTAAAFTPTFYGAAYIRTAPRSRLRVRSRSPAT